MQGVERGLRLAMHLSGAVLADAPSDSDRDIPQPRSLLIASTSLVRPRCRVDRTPVLPLQYFECCTGTFNTRRSPSLGVEAGREENLHFALRKLGKAVGTGLRNVDKATFRGIVH
jgi:hypothetical protein